MSAIYAAVREVADALTAAGIRSTTDPRNLAVPGVWVTLDHVSPGVLCGTPEVHVAIVLVARDAGQRAYLERLSDMYADVAAVIDVEGDVRPEMVTLPSGGAPLPSLTLTTTV